MLDKDQIEQLAQSWEAAKIGEINYYFNKDGKAHIRILRKDHSGFSSYSEPVDGKGIVHLPVAVFSELKK